MEIFKLLNLSFGIKADFSNIYDKLTVNKDITVSDLSLDVLGMEEKHVLFLKKGQESEIVYLLFNRPNMNINFSLQKYAMTYNERPDTPKAINLEELNKKIDDITKKVLSLLKAETIKFISSPFFHIELLFFDDENDYSKLLTEKALPKNQIAKSKLMKATLGFTVAKKMPQYEEEKDYNLEVLIEHWIQNQKFLFISGTAQWNILEYQYKNLEFFKIWLSDIFDSGCKTLRKLKEE